MVHGETKLEVEINRDIKHQAIHRQEKFASIFQLENQGIAEVIQVGGLDSCNMFTE